MLSTVQSPDVTLLVGDFLLLCFVMYLCVVFFRGFRFYLTNSMGSMLLFLGKKLYVFFLVIGGIGVIDLWLGQQLSVALLRSCLTSSVVCFLYRRWNDCQDQQLIEAYQLYQGKEDLHWLRFKTRTKEVVIHQDRHFPPHFPDRLFESTQLVYQIPYSCFQLKVCFSGRSSEEELKKIGSCFLNIFCSVVFCGFSLYGLFMEQRILAYGAIVCMSVALFFAERRHFVLLCKKLWLIQKQWWKTLIDKGEG